MENRNRFINKHVLITGAARGIGFEVAKQFASEGAMVSLVDYNADNLQNSVQELKNNGFDVYGYNADISKRNEVEDAVEKAESCQPIDILINNAGIASETPFINIGEEEWRKILDINLTGIFYVSQVVCRKMIARKSGVVVNMGSKNGMDGEFGYAHYNASKGGVIMLTKTMALELASFGIRVNVVCPGYIQTPLSMEIDSPEFTDDFVKRYIPMNRPGKVEEVASIFLFLASNESSFMTGQTIVADGGQLAGQKPSAELLAKNMSAE